MYLIGLLFIVFLLLTVFANLNRIQARWYFFSHYRRFGQTFRQAVILWRTIPKVQRLKKQQIKKSLLETPDCFYSVLLQIIFLKKFMNPKSKQFNLYESLYRHITQLPIIQEATLTEFSLVHFGNVDSSDIRHNIFIPGKIISNTPQNEQFCIIKDLCWNSCRFIIENIFEANKFVKLQIETDEGDFITMKCETFLIKYSIENRFSYVNARFIHVEPEDFQKLCQLVYQKVIPPDELPPIPQEESISAESSPQQKPISHIIEQESMERFLTDILNRKL